MINSGTEHRAIINGEIIERERSCSLIAGNFFEVVIYADKSVFDTYKDKVGNTFEVGITGTDFLCKAELKDVRIIYSFDEVVSVNLKFKY